MTTDSRHDDPIAPNLLKQQFEAAELDQKWLTEITAIWTQEGWLSSFRHPRCLFAPHRWLVDELAARCAYQQSNCQEISSLFPVFTLVCQKAAIQANVLSLRKDIFPAQLYEILYTIDF